jgi:SAM-dependent methyltransferase
METERANIDLATVDGFGAEWEAFDQTAIDANEFETSFDAYFGVFPFDELPEGAEGFDLGCGSGRWASRVISRVGLLHCIDPSPKALEVAKRRLGHNPKAQFHLAASDSIPLADDSQDFGYALGVLHHIPDVRRAMEDCVRKLRPGAPFLVYIYYRLDGRPGWYRALWHVSDLFRRGIARLPFPARKLMTSAIAALIYWPLSRSALVGEQLGFEVSNFPLSAYRRASLYTLRTDALDRFGTRLEQRFLREEIKEMMEAAGLIDVQFSENSPFWVACGRKQYPCGQ